MLDAIKDLLGCTFFQTNSKHSQSYIITGNNNASTKEGLQWRGRSNGQCNGDGCGGGGFGDSESGTGVDGTAGSGPDKLEGAGPTENDALHLKRRVGLISGVALIVGTMIGNF
ncbi:hypothetical protein QE152_g15362 [Popillia japonica]|uniref:Uncharacterized protein n=1 Tax=Popillia japonica TaxID=7064 RepID=A0AAW1L8A6_POPJA